MDHLISMLIVLQIHTHYTTMAIYLQPFRGTDIHPCCGFLHYNLQWFCA